MGIDTESLAFKAPSMFSYQGLDSNFADRGFTSEDLDKVTTFILDAPRMPLAEVVSTRSRLLTLMYERGPNNFLEGPEINDRFEAVKISLEDMLLGTAGQIFAELRSVLQSRSWSYQDLAELISSAPKAQRKNLMEYVRREFYSDRGRKNMSSMINRNGAVVGSNLFDHVLPIFVDEVLKSTDEDSDQIWRTAVRKALRKAQGTEVKLLTYVADFQKSAVITHEMLAPIESLLLEVPTQGLYDAVQTGELSPKNRHIWFTSIFKHGVDRSYLKRFQEALSNVVLDLMFQALGN